MLQQRSYIATLFSRDTFPRPLPASSACLTAVSSVDLARSVRCGDVRMNDEDRTPPFAIPSMDVSLRSLITVYAYIHDNQLPHHQQRQDLARTNEPEHHQRY